MNITRNTRIHRVPLFLFLIPFALILLQSCGRTSDASSRPPAKAEAIPKLTKSKADWRRLLPADTYAVMFENGTEPSGSSPLNGEKRSGTFICAACNLPLFRSNAKFESGTGWPSFYEPIAGHVEFKSDLSLLLPRTEYHCARCGGHEGHIFDDGPPPTGKRYCNNGVALRFIPDGQPLPPLRS